MMDGSQEIAPIIDIHYDGNLEIRHFFDEEGSASANPMKVFKALYEFNDKRELKGLKYYDKDNNPMNNAYGISEYIWKNLDNNKVLEKRKNVLGEYVAIRPYYKLMNVIFEYNSNGMLAAMKNVDDNGQLIEEETGIASDKQVYDDQFQLTSFKFYNAKQENIIGSFLDSAGGEIIYDEKGNTIKYITTDLEGKLRSGSRNWAIN